MIYIVNKPKDIFDLDDATPHWDHFEYWFVERLDEEMDISTPNSAHLYDEAREMVPKDLLDYLKEMKYSANDCLKMRDEVPGLYNDFLIVCDQRVNEIKQELIGLWREE